MNQKKIYIQPYIAMIVLMLVVTFIIGQIRSQEENYTRDQFYKNLDQGSVSQIVVNPNKEVPTGYLEVTLKDGTEKRLYVTEGLKPRFVEGCLANGEFRVGKWADEAEARKLAGKIWGDWYAIASWTFNKSHAVAYAWLAYQSAYLKAHYPAEFMLGMMRYES